MSKLSEYILHFIGTILFDRCEDDSVGNANFLRTLSFQFTLCTKNNGSEELK
jgi:hypothetical protein